MSFAKLLSTSALAFALLSGGSAITGLSLTSPAAAAEKLSEAVGKPLSEAQKLLKAGNYAGALAKANQANIGGKKPNETYYVGLIMFNSALGLSDIPNMQKGLDLAASSGMLSAGDRRNYEKTILQSFSKKRQWAKVISEGNAYLSKNGQDADVIALVADANMNTGNLKGAEASLKQVIAARGANANLYDALISVQYKIGGNDYAFPTYVEKLRKFPTADSWNKVITMTEKAARGSDIAQAELYRLRLLTGSLASGDYITAGKQMMVVRFYGDAANILDKGAKAGYVGKGQDGARELRLLDQAKAEANKAKAGFAQTEAQALRSPNGQALVQAGSIARSNGDPRKGADLIQQGIAKGGLRSVEDAMLELGVAQMEAGQKSAAIKTFGEIKGKAPSAAAAKLFAIYAK